ncbi:HAD superfamily hydrolase [Secundilactobacillus odoratitofui DSM 19909 = JCM 15043]|uniref:HAD superfamily hydrolase n=1 Tax=Secundilactobacillus odoratitofui DSM 19909 = JCM 15043 TaxID=1423776 RepID=A0A0R1LYY2_9LACO|nr:YjjG family noncanonical pyrimidine nucleotidase [Secundilactobacillus odoratitofui]KRK96967.1 HAD superfamily hydrolase [Secundilactobacillus odoratitofui DSM 19909 = JCM 15043]
MAYQTLLFDIDDTLLNFQAAEKQAMVGLFQELNLPLSDDTYRFYHHRNAELWRQFELGNITKTALLSKRFTDLFAYLGEPDVNGPQIEKRYRHYLSMGHEPMPHATEVLQALKPQHDLYIVTNGVAKTQQKRLAESHFDQYFNQVFISELIGAQKPEPAFFERATSQIKAFDANQALVIGDSLSSDIKGANAVGIDSVWFNPQHQANQSDVRPTYEIDQLTDLTQIVA